MSDTENPLEPVGRVESPVKGWDDVSASVSQMRTQDGKEPGKGRLGVLAVLFCVLPCIGSCVWMLIPASENGGWSGDVSLALVVTVKIPIVGITWAVNAVLLINNMNSRGNYTSNLLVVAITPLITGIMLRVFYSTFREHSYYFLLCVGASYTLAQLTFALVTIILKDKNFGIEARSAGVTFVLGMQLAMSCTFGWVFTLATSGVQMVMCASYPFLVLIFKGLINVIVPRDLPPSKHLIIGGVSQLYAALPYRIIFMQTRGGNWTVVGIYLVEVFFKAVVYIAPVTGLTRGFTRFLPTSIPQPTQQGYYELSIKFCLHQLLDFSQAFVMVIYLAITSRANLSTLASLSGMSRYMRNRLLVVYTIGCVLEVVLFAVVPRIAIALGAQGFSPVPSLSQVLRGPPFYVFISGCLAVQVIMLAYIGNFDF